MSYASRIVRGGEVMWVGKRPKGQNLYCKDQQKVTDLYRNNYDLIEWDTGKNVNDEEEMSGEKEAHNVIS